MKKIIIFTALLAFISIKAQVKTNRQVSESTANNSTAFLDASSSPLWNGTKNNGKGFVFPRTDLTKLTKLIQSGPNIPTNFPNRMDGMIVYNTVEGKPAIGATETPKVTPGFYYYKNESNDLQGGHWVRIGSGEPNMVKDADYKSKAVATGANFFINDTDSKPVYRKMVEIDFNGTSARLPDNTFTTNDVFISAYLVNQGTSEIVGSVKIYKQVESGKDVFYVRSSNGSLSTTLNGIHKLITEYYQK